MDTEPAPARGPSEPVAHPGGTLTRIAPFLLLGLAILFWAGNSIVGRAVRDDIPPFTLAFGRWLLAVAMVAPFALGPLRREWDAVRRGWAWILVLGLFGVVCFNGFLYKGLHFTTAANALLLQAAIPALVMVLDRLLFGARSGALQAAGVAVSTLGVLAIVFRGDPAALLAMRLGKGDALVFGAVLAWSLYTVFLRRRPPISPSVFLLLTFALGALAMAPLALAEAMAGQAVHWRATTLGAFFYVGLFPSVLAYLIYNRATAELGPARAGQAITLLPLCGALLSALLLGERLAPWHIAGMALILVGIVISALAIRRPT